PASITIAGPDRASYASATGTAGRVIERSSTSANRRSARPDAPNPYVQAASRRPPDADLPRHTDGHPRGTRMAATSTRQDQEIRSSLQVGTSPTPLIGRVDGRRKRAGGQEAGEALRHSGAPLFERSS